MVLEKDMVKRMQAQALALEGLDNRTIGQRMGLTHQRVQQLIPEVRTVKVRFTEIEGRNLDRLASRDRLSVAQVIRHALKLP